MAPQPAIAPPRVLVVPRAIVRDTHEFFLPYWRAKVETACFWFGVGGNGRQVVTTLAIPRLFQSGGQYKVESSSLRRLAMAMQAQGLTNLAQVHTHPPGGVGHSPYDDANAYSTRDGALSLIWPSYGLSLHHTLDGIGVHERIGDRWIHLDEEATTQRISLVDSRADFRWEIMRGETDDAE